MARLSNFLRGDDGSADSSDHAPQIPLQTRPVRREEVDRALRLLLASPSGLASDEQVLDFVSFAVHRGVEVGAIWVAERGGQIEWSLLPVLSPGRTMLILAPNRPVRQTPPESVIALVNAICDEHARGGVHLAQLLLDPDHPDVHEIYARAGFRSLAQLVYLRRTIRRTSGRFELPANLELKSYSRDLDSLFTSAIARSYEGSLDCPGLNGLRDIHDVLEGHKGSGEFDPSLWHVLLENGEERAVLLLNRSAQSDSMELVYLGLVQAARGRGISDLMMKFAIDQAVRDRRAELSLAVDSRNAPALKLYLRHGMQRIASRTAMIRDLRPVSDVNHGAARG